MKEGKKEIEMRGEGKKGHKEGRSKWIKELMEERSNEGGKVGQRDDSLYRETINQT